MGVIGRVAALFSLLALVVMTSLFSVMPPVSRAAETAMGTEPGATDPLQGAEEGFGYLFQDVSSEKYLCFVYDGSAGEFRVTAKDAPDRSCLFILHESPAPPIYEFENPESKSYLVTDCPTGSVCNWGAAAASKRKDHHEWGFVLFPNPNKDGTVAIAGIFGGGLKLELVDGSWVAKFVDSPADVTYFRPISSEPIHWVIDGVIRPTVIVSEPPKHIDYTVNADGKLGELNISRKTGFYSIFQDKNQTEISSSNNNTSDWNFGVQKGATVSAGFSLPIVGGIQTDVSKKVEDTYSQHESEINKNMTTTTTTEVLKANTDDYLVYNLTRFHIWIYPIPGSTVKDENGKEGPLYMQIVVPATAGNNPQKASGRDVEWYQPVHQNGNLFSYPWIQEQLERFENTDDLYILTNPNSFSAGGNEMSFSIDWTQATEKGAEVKAQHKLSTDASVSVSGKVESLSAKATVSTHYDQTWSQLTTSNTKLTKSQGITIAKSVLDEQYAYQVSPFIYTRDVEEVAQGGATIQMPTGTIKLAFTVDPTVYDATREWWESVSGYSSKPDLALNLPHQWVSTDGGNNWKFGRNAYNFQMMKGLFVEDSEGNSIDYWTEEGNTVTVKTRVYNYSFVDAHNVKVKFEAQGSKDGNAWGDRFEVGTDTVSLIRGFQNAAGENNWEWAEVAFGTSGKALNMYRLWVTVDPDNEIEEIQGHDLSQDYGNNEGYFGIPLYVAPKDSSENMSGHNLSFKAHSDDLVALSSSRPAEGEMVMATFWVGADGAHASNVLISFYDGDPEQGGELIDIEFIPFIGEGEERFLQIHWETYGEVGNHQIHAVIHSQWGETDITDNIAMAAIEVVPASEGLQWYHIVAIVIGAMAVIVVGIFGVTLIRGAR